MWKFLVLSTFLAAISTASGSAVACCGAGAGAFASAGGGAFASTGGGAFTKVGGGGNAGGASISTCTSTGDGGTSHFSFVGGNGKGVIVSSTGGDGVVYSTTPGRKCGANEKYVMTRYSDPTCDEPAHVLPCTISAYRCDSGYVRHNGKCIRKCNCPKKCPKNCPKREEWVCTKYSEPTCYEPAKELCKSVTECRCIKGYVRHNGKCIKECNCPFKCPGPNEELRHTDFEDATCDVCEAVACEPTTACRCKPGYVRGPEGICILPCQCPAKCPPNEHWTLAYFTDPTCTKDKVKLDRPVNACRCNDGLVRHKGKCVDPCKCPCHG